MKRLLLFGIFFSSFILSNAQKDLSGPEKKHPGLIKLKDGINRTQAQMLFKNYFEATPDDEMRLSHSETDNLGFFHEKYQQYFKGIKIDGATYTIHSKNGLVKTMSGSFRDIKKVDISPAISADAALNLALTHIHAKTYAWEDAVKSGFPDYKKPTGELVIFADPDFKEEAVLAYKFDVYAAEPIYRAWVYVNAKTGKVIMENSRIHETNVSSSANTLYNGSRSVTSDYTGSNYRLRQTSSGSGVQTFSLNNTTNYGNATDITSNSNSFTNDPAANQAHWGAERTYDYYFTKYNRNSYNNTGGVLKSYVHYSNNYVNAFWDGTRMTYGDGNGTTYGPLVSLDICGHELTHGVTEYSANLVYSNQPGALNESFSDIFGEAIENYSLGTNDWLMGKDIGIGGSGAIRSMSNPNQFNNPDTYGGTYWYTGTSDYGGVHTNSGVQNKWFYILTVGESGSNDLGNSYSVIGIGINKAAAIAYRNLTVYLSSSSNYADARQGAIQAAIDLFGAGSAEEIATTNAWYAVGVGCAYGSVCYCASAGSTSTYEWIKTVTVGSFTNNSGAAGYSDFTGQTINLAAGSSNNVSLVPGFRSTTYNEYWKIWIDFNADGDFDDAGEQVFSKGLSKTTVTGTITIPAVATGITRMRVSMKYNAQQTSPCEIFGYGEVEDYTVSFSGAGPDNQPPTAPVLSSPGKTSTTIDLSWTAAIDNVGVTGYEVYANGVLKTTTASLSYTVTGLTASTAYSLYVRAKDAAGNGTNSNTISVTTALAPDIQPPSAPVLSSPGKTSTTIDLSWTAATDNLGVTGYEVYANGVLKTTTVSLSYMVTGLTASTAYSLYIRSKDAAGNGTNSNTISVTTSAAADNQPPSAPVLSTPGKTSTTIDLSWTAATDNVGVTGYEVYANGVLKTTTVSLSYTVTGLTASTAYSLYVRAKDAAGNGTNSNTIAVTTQGTGGGTTTILAHYFETGWDGWTDGGSDCGRYSGSRSYEGNYSIYIRDNSGIASAMTSSAYNVSAYNQLVIDFYFYAVSLENNEDFWVRYFNGSSWSTVATFVAGTDFNNNGFYHATVTLNAVNFPTNAQFRFQCDASANDDLIYIDQVTVTGSNTGSFNGNQNIFQSCDLISSSTEEFTGDELSKTLIVYPNPAINSLTVQTESAIKSIKIYSISGSLVKQFGMTKNGTQLDISLLKAGLYIANFETDDGMIARKFIKQ